MKVNYLCDCGERNTIEMKRRPQDGKPTLFYCSGCGLPSRDVCTLCGHLTDSESNHRFCQSCGASGDRLRRGARVVDIALNFRTVVVASVTVGSLMYLHQAYLLPLQRRQLLADHTPDPRWILILFVALGLHLHLPTLWSPLCTFLTGVKKPDVAFRALAYGSWLPPVNTERERELTVFALKTRARIKILKRKFWYKLPLRFRTWARGTNA